MSQSRLDDTLRLLGWMIFLASESSDRRQKSGLHKVNRRHEIMTSHDFSLLLG